MEDISALKERYGQQTRIYKRYNILNVLVPHKSEEFDLHTFLDLEFLSIDTSDKDKRKIVIYKNTWNYPLNLEKTAITQNYHVNNNVTSCQPTTM